VDYTLAGVVAQVCFSLRRGPQCSSHPGKREADMPRQAPNALDTASKQVIGHTCEEWKGFVRLYFRPRTPTQYQIEGFRPVGQFGSLGAYMSMPVFFLFDAKDILTRKTARFSEGNLASGSSVGEDAAYFESIPFQKVYHDNYLSEEEKPNIKFHRHAEVIVPDELGLEGLEYVWCRSEAEYQTLLALLPAGIRRRYFQRIRQGRRPSLHFCRWTYLESASLEQNQIVFRFNRSSVTPGPFHALVQVKNQRTGAAYKWERQDFEASHDFKLGIPQIAKPSAYEITLHLDNNIAFASSFAPKSELLTAR